MFETIVNADGTISIVPVEQNNNLPFKSMVDMAAENANLDLFPAPQDFYTSPTYIQKQQLGYDFPTGITSSSVARDMSSIPFGTSVDNFQGFTDKVDFSKPPEPSGIKKLVSYLPFGEKSVTGTLIRALAPKSSPESKFMRDFYSSRFGLTPTGQVGSGIMKGYNPVSGGFLNMITGGKFGSPTKYGLQNAYQKRIDRIKKTLQKKYIDKGRSLDETDLDERLAEIEKLKQEELNAFIDFVKSRAPQPEGLGDIGTGGGIIPSGGGAGDRDKSNDTVGPGGTGSRKGAADIPDRTRGSYATDDTASFF